MPRKLTVVTDKTPPPPRRRAAPRTIRGAVAEDRTERELLVAMRRKVAEEIDQGVPAHALAPLMRQLRELDKEIRGLDARAKSEERDEYGDSDRNSSDATFDASAI